MAYEPTIWKDRIVEKPKTYTIQNNPDGSITLIPAPGVVTEEGTPVNANNLNKLEQGLKTHEAESAKEPDDPTHHVKKDGTLQTGLNAEKLGGKLASDFLQGTNSVFITGTYTGNGSANRTISLGFRAKAVLLFERGSRTYENYLSKRIYGGLALDGYPVYAQESSKALEIMDNGFRVGTVDTDLKQTNEKNSIYHFIAFK